MDLSTILGLILGLLGLNYLWTVGRDVRLHDQLVRNRDEDLGNWIDDADGDLTTELGKLTRKHVGTEHVQWPLYLRKFDKQQAKDEVLKRLGDQLRDATRYRQEIELSEGWHHRAWRRIASKPLPELSAEQEKSDVIDRWKKPVTDEDIQGAEKTSSLIRRLALKRSTPTGPFPPGHG
jgi:hypothetical protein